ncbi:MAG: ABC transporter ATP-binding protein [Pleurocapsa sp. SU_5_0]|nr:ABC transporter ATP-binding protein [Pleurocapsa sp. SU_5_0]NJO98063.1 ABC transporter ATP-binding protein [Pleurocapsa sp. CRU_1_2]
MLIRPKIPIAIRKLLKSTSFWQDNFIILREFKHFRAIAITALICTILAAFLDGTSVGLIASFLQGLTTPNSPPIQTRIEWFDVKFLATKASPEERLYRLSALILLVVWLKSSLRYWGAYNIKLAQSNLCDRLRKRIFEQLQSLSLAYYSTSHSGELINSITTEINQIKQAFQLFAVLVVKSSSLIAYVISIFWLSWQLAITAIFLYALLSVSLSNLIARVREASFAVPKANGRLASIAIQFISGIKTVKGSATESFEQRRFYRASTNVVEAEDRVASISALIEPLAEAVGSSILIFMVLIAFNFFITSGQLQASSLLTFMFALLRILPLVSQINGARENLNRFQGSIYNIQELLKTENKSYLDNGKLVFSELKQAIYFKGVDFGYDLSERILNNVNLTIEKGKVTALVGASGAGKSTLVDLIARFYDPVKGTVRLDEEDLCNFDIYSLRRKMSIVSQDTFIFNASVKENIAYGLERIEESEILKAASLANAGQFIRDLPEGLNTILGDRGVRLSGGQRQRIAIARAILRNPDILILDEATSALDSVTEQLIQESLEQLSQGRTVITIAHRLSTIANADKVVVLEQGRIIEQGSYHDLLIRKGALWKYHQMQYELSATG